LDNKKYNIKYNIGKCKYLLSFHDGIQKHKDDSEFFDIRTFKNKIYLNNFIKELKTEGYIEV